MAAAEVVQQALRRGAHRGQFQLPKLAAAMPASLFLSFPHRYAHLPLNALRRSRRDISSCAVNMGWRFLVQQRRIDAAKTTFDPIAAITAIDIGGGRFVLGETNESPFVQGSQTAVRRAELLEVVREQSFEAVLLSAPAVYVVALWLSSKTGGGGMVLPIPPLPPGVIPYEPVTEADFLKTLSALARSVR
jgi:hypothetical protein